VAEWLHPYRWWLFGATVGLFSFAVLLVLLGFLGYPAPFFAVITPRLGAPLLATLLAWSCGAFLLPIWFAPSRPPSTRSTALARTLRAFQHVIRFWSLFVLVLVFLAPLFMWFFLWRGH